jgi:hypothetical protein
MAGEDRYISQHCASRNAKVSLFRDTHSRLSTAEKPCYKSDYDLDISILKAMRVWNAGEDRTTSLDWTLSKSMIELCGGRTAFSRSYLHETGHD